MDLYGKIFDIIIWCMMNKMQNTLWYNPLHDQHFIGKKTEMRGYTEKVRLEPRPSGSRVQMFIYYTLLPLMSCVILQRYCVTCSISNGTRQISL